MNNTPLGNRIHIGFFGNRNAGKSSLVNAITNQNISVVSDIAGTTTDPVYKTMELLPLGPVVIIDTPGFDDEGTLGELRIERTKKVMEKVDIAVLVVDASIGMTDYDYKIVSMLKERNINFIIAYNKYDKRHTSCNTETNPAKGKDVAENSLEPDCMYVDAPYICVSATGGTNINELKEAIGRLIPTEASEKKLVADLISKHDLVLLVVPIDKAAPKGRLILPQQQVIRDIIEAGSQALVVRDTELEDAIKRFGNQVKLVITDSQVFSYVMNVVPANCKLTSFSIIMARYKGQLDTAVHGAYMLDELNDGDKILISEGCTHHRQCDDIGSVKLPKWIDSYSGKKLTYDFTSGGSFPEDLSPYRLVVHCGGCMLNEREMKLRQSIACRQNVAMTNYGTAIAHMNGILGRSIEVFEE